MKQIFVPALVGLIAVSGTAWADGNGHRKNHHERSARAHGHSTWSSSHWQPPGHVRARQVVLRPVYAAPPVVVYQAPQVVYRERVVYRDSPVYYPGYPSAPGVYRPSSGDPLIGQALGAIAGGVIGNQIGKGNGRVIATAAGAVIGGAVGGRVAAY